MFNLQDSPEQLMEVEPRSQSPAANSETELDFAKRSRSVEDLNKVDDVERELESSSSSLDAGGVIQGRPSSNYSVQCKVDLRNVQKAKATGSNSRFKNAGIIQEEGDYVDSPKHQARKEVLRTFSSFKCSPSWNTVNT